MWRHVVPLAAVEIPAARLRANAAPLLEEEWDALDFAEIPQIPAC